MSMCEFWWFVYYWYASFSIWSHLAPSNQRTDVVWQLHRAWNILLSLVWRNPKAQGAKMFDPARMVHYLRGWIGFVGLMALGNTIQCFRNHMFLKERLYNGKPHEGMLFTTNSQKSWNVRIRLSKKNNCRSRLLIVLFMHLTDHNYWYIVRAVWTNKL